ncbi:MAG TPA: hypothetical protein VMV10_13925 [Pirellulales bacterium]|nr:hypothetical protein [Pirellulales bacterium]
MSAALAGGDLWAGAIESGASDPADSAANPSQLKWLSPKLTRSARAAQPRPLAPAGEAAPLGGLELRSATGKPVAEAKVSQSVDSADASPAIVLTTAEEPAVDPFDDPFEDRKPKPSKRSELKLFPVVRAAELQAIDTDEQAPPPADLDAFGRVPAERAPDDDAAPKQMPPDEAPQDELPLLGGGRDGADAQLPGEDEFAQNPPIQAERCPTPRDLKPIGDITNKIAAEPGLFPQECSLGEEPFQPRSFARTEFTWRASALCHKPLYFEQPGVERYGHTFGPFLQPVVSTGHFFASVIMLPYKMGLEPPWECVYPLGHYRPGSCAPYTVGPVPISARGVLSQAGITLGLVYVFAP